MASEFIHIEVQDPLQATRILELPREINLSLMEVLKASEYDIPATCGGIALCATCHIEVTRGLEQLNPPSDIEMDMIDTLPDATTRSRLACQIRLGDELDGMKLLIKHQAAIEK